MPYLPPKFREELDQQCEIGQITRYFESLDDQNFLGALNYLVYTIVRHYLFKNGKRYSRLAGIVGTIHCCAAEIYRRIAAPYEDEKIEENGDV